MNPLVIAFVALAVLVIVVLVKGAAIVPQKEAYIVERLGKYSRTLEAGFHVLIPFIDNVAYRFSLKESVVDVPAQVCITQDNVSVEVDGVLYIEVQDPVKAAYGIDYYLRGASQLAQTTLRSALGKISLDKTFEERESINAEVVTAIDEAAQTWGVKVLRYEIKDITPPVSVRDAMEKQMTAERDKRAKIAASEGERQSLINQSEGEKQQIINQSEARKLQLILGSEGEKQRQINEAEGQAQQVTLVAEAEAARIRMLAEATAEGVSAIARAIDASGGLEAANMRLAEGYIAQFGKVARKGTTLILPQNLADISGLVATAMATLKKPGA